MTSRSVAAWICAGLATVAPAAGAAERIALLPLDAGQGLVVGAADLEAAVMRGLQVAGRPLVSPADVVMRLSQAPGEPACETPECWARVGRSIPADYLVQGAVTREGEVFRATLRLLRVTDGHVIAVEENQCEVAFCSVAELARRSARELLRQTLGRSGDDLSAARSIPDAPPVLAPAAVPPTAEATARAEPRRRWWPGAVVGAGLVATGAGVFYIARHDDCADEGCYRQHDSLRGGIALVGAGLALATAGVVFWLHPAADASVAFVIGARGAALVGRF